jgi:hypothetical protein
MEARGPHVVPVKLVSMAFASLEGLAVAQRQAGLALGRREASRRKSAP